MDLTPSARATIPWHRRFPVSSPSFVDPERPRFLGRRSPRAITASTSAQRHSRRAARAREHGAGPPRRSLDVRGPWRTLRVEPFAAYFALGEAPKSSEPARLRAGLHPAHGGRTPAGDSPLLAREILVEPHDPRSRRRSSPPTHVSASACCGFQTTRHSERSSMPDSAVGRPRGVGRTPVGQ